MIREILEFTKKIERDIPEISSWYIKPSEGIHFYKTGIYDLNL